MSPSLNSQWTSSQLFPLQFLAQEKQRGLTIPDDGIFDASDSSCIKIDGIIPPMKKHQFQRTWLKAGNKSKRPTKSSDAHQLFMLLLKQSFCKSCGDEFQRGQIVAKPFDVLWLHSLCEHENRTVEIFLPCVSLSGRDVLLQQSTQAL